MKPSGETPIASGLIIQRAGGGEGGVHCAPRYRGLGSLQSTIDNG